MQLIQQEMLSHLRAQNKEYFEQISELRKANHEYLERIIELTKENQRLSNELFELKQSQIESGINSIMKKPKTRKPSAPSPTPPPHVLKQMEKAIALLNQQQGTSTSLADFDILPIELDEREK